MSDKIFTDENGKPLTGRAKSSAVGLNNIEKSGAQSRFKKNPEAAAEAGRKSGESKRKNKAFKKNLLELLGGTSDQMKEMETALKGFSPAKVMNAIAIQKMDEGDVDGAVEIFSKTAEFSDAKIQRNEVKQEVVNYDADFSLEDLQLMSTLVQAIDLMNNGVEPAVYLTNKGAGQHAGKSKEALEKELELIKQKAGGK